MCMDLTKATTFSIPVPNAACELLDRPRGLRGLDASHIKSITASKLDNIQRSVKDVQAAVLQLHSGADTTEKRLPIRGGVL